MPNETPDSTEPTASDLSDAERKAVRDYINELEEEGLVRDKRLTYAAKAKIRQYMLLLVGIPSFIGSVLIFFVGFFAQNVGYQSAYNHALENVTQQIASFIADTKKAQGDAETAAKIAKEAGEKAEKAHLDIDASAEKATQAQSRIAVAESQATASLDKAKSANESFLLLQQRLAQLENVIKTVEGLPKTIQDIQQLSSKIAEDSNFRKSVAETVNQTIEPRLKAVENSALRLETGQQQFTVNSSRFQVKFAKAFSGTPRVSVHFTNVTQGIDEKRDMAASVSASDVTKEGFTLTVGGSWPKLLTVEWLAFGQ
jgi:hypothetical protein